MDGKSAYLELTIISAADLKRSWLSGNQTAAVAWVHPSDKKTTSIVSGHHSNVQWPHEKLILSLNGVGENLAHGKLLTIEIHARGAWGDRLLGSVYVPLIELGRDGEKSASTILMYQIVKPSGKQQGSMKFLAKIVQPRVNASSGIPTEPSAPPAPYPSHVYPPSNTLYPAHTSPAEACMPHSDYTCNTPYPPASPLDFEAPYPPPTSVYPPHTVYSEAPYPPVAPYHQFPQTSPPYPHSDMSSVYPPHTVYSEAPYPPIASYSGFLSPSYAQQPATIHYH